MADVLIEHCKLRVVRSQGWSWGPSPRQLLQNAVQQLPELLAHRLASLFGDEQDMEISTPLSIRLRVSMDDLLSLSVNDAGAVSSFSSLDRQLTEKLAAAIAEQVPESGTEPLTSVDQLESPSGLNAEADTESPLQCLRSWYLEGKLGYMLSRFSPAALEVWHRALLDDTTEGEGAPSLLRRDIDTYIKEYQTQHSAATNRMTDDARADCLRARLWVIAAIVINNKGLPARHNLLAALDDRLPLPLLADNDRSPSNTDAVIEQDFIAARESHREPKMITGSAHTHVQFPAPLLDADCYVASALPFLLLGPLEHLGYLRLLRMSLMAARQPEWLPCFATGLALKILQPLERGWRRHQEDRNIASVFAGLDSPLEENTLVTFARETSGLLSPLDALLEQSLREGHRPGQALLLSRVPSQGGGGFMLFDVDGLFPITWCDTIDELLPVVQGFESDVLLIPEDAADTQLLQQLQSAGVPFLTDAPPTRGEFWYMLHGKEGKRMWSNSSALPESVPMRNAHHFENTTEDAAACVNAFTVERKALPISDESELERTLTLGVGVALASIAWHLWREREPTHPLLALHRFADLDARVRFDRERVRVRLPMGKRHRDLYEHGLTRDVPNVPWLGGRSVEFSGG